MWTLRRFLQDVIRFRFWSEKILFQQSGKRYPRSKICNEMKNPVEGHCRFRIALFAGGDHLLGFTERRRVDQNNVLVSRTGVGEVAGHRATIYSRTLLPPQAYSLNPPLLPLPPATLGTALSAWIPNSRGDTSPCRLDSANSINAASSSRSLTQHQTFARPFAWRLRAAEIESIWWANSGSRLCTDQVSLKDLEWATYVQIGGGTCETSLLPISNRHSAASSNK